MKFAVSMPSLSGFYSGIGAGEAVGMRVELARICCLRRHYGEAVAGDEVVAAAGGRERTQTQSLRRK